MFRPSFALTAEKPGSDVAGETAAAMAAGALVFREAGGTVYNCIVLTFVICKLYVISIVQNKSLVLMYNAIAATDIRRRCN